jgi:hypothetical protein
MNAIDVYLILVALSLTFVATIWSASGILNQLVKFFYMAISTVTWAVLVLKSGWLASVLVLP